MQFMNFCLFFPTLVAGPIAKYEDFSFQALQKEEDIEDNISEGGKRIAIGMFKKFILADNLAMMALNPINANQIEATGWMWLALIFFSFQIYFDFSGYSDIAIGLGQLLGFHLPENFDHPYLKSNLAKFWDSWHITLSQWIRTYFFNPFNRYLRKTKFSNSPLSILFITQLATMAIIGLWHGITWTFFIWGLWHGVGLFLQNRWSHFVKIHFPKIQKNLSLQKAIQIISTMITFTYVSLGWVWFLSATPQQAGNIFLVLFGKG